MLASGGGEDFPLVAKNVAATFIEDDGIDPAVARAVIDLRNDVGAVTGITPATKLSNEPNPPSVAVIVGIAGQSEILSRLETLKILDLGGLRAAWESFVITVVEKPWPGLDRALVIAGSDRRGAIFGCYELSEAIGISPWRWWADVPPLHRENLFIAGGTHKFGPPSVKYRGIFINDEDWGLQPWAAKTFEPEHGGIGPKTYAKVFELLLRLKANTLWPAMHGCTHPFNSIPDNSQMASDYGIVMGSSHAEPMLRNNVGEWKDSPERYNFVTNREGVLAYWEKRVSDNGGYENIYTIGMRGIHDSNMIGPKTDEDRIRVLEQVFSDQRAILRRNVRRDAGWIPQMFCAYKEVLELYRKGLRVPQDATIVWPDDNFGYVRSFTSESERSRNGGSGVYYHLSYLGRPLSYLWLSTTPPALIWQQMHQSYEHGANRIWITNVGDIKPSEISTEFFLQMAWDINRWTPENLDQYLVEWSEREFGAQQAEKIASMMSQYYLLNFQRKPEHLQWWFPGNQRRQSDFSDEEVRDRLSRFTELRHEADKVGECLEKQYRDAYFELVRYPIVGSALANERYFAGEQGDVARAQKADIDLKSETKRFNEGTAGGKWRGIISLEPADNQWSTMRIAPWAPFSQTREPKVSAASKNYSSIDAANFQKSVEGRDGAWRLIPGLGRTGKALTVLPSNGPHYNLATIGDAPRLDYKITVPAAGEYAIELHLLPTHAREGTTLRLAVSVDDGPARLLMLSDVDDMAWSRGVLDGARRLATQVGFKAGGNHSLQIYGIEPGVVIDKIVVDFGAAYPTYLGPNKSLREYSP